MKDHFQRSNTEWLQVEVVVEANRSQQLKKSET